MKQRKLVIGRTTINSERAALRLSQDIAALSARLTRLKKQTDPDPKTLQNCQELLRSRHAMLDWLRQTHRDTGSVSLD